VTGGNAFFQCDMLQTFLINDVVGMNKLLVLAMLLTNFPVRIKSFASLRRGRVASLVSLHGSVRVHPAQRLPGLTSEERPADPSSLTDWKEASNDLLDWLEAKSSVLCITGAGLSTESGIPDYRGHAGSYWKNHQPIRHDQFISSHKKRQRYWGRSLFGWRDFDEKQPNRGHVALARLQESDRLGVKTAMGRRIGIITQNVDRLHSKAGSKNVLELHGRTNQLVCMSCGHLSDRRDFQTQLEADNDKWIREQQERLQEEGTSSRPDGDAAIETSFDSLRLPSCNACGTGVLKPNVVFFGDTVPRDRVQACRQAVEASDGVLVIGSSLSVHSAWRHVKAALDANISVAVLNVGPTRADGKDGVVQLHAPAGPVLEAVAMELAR